MVALSRCMGSAALLATTEALRRSVKQHGDSMMVMFKEGTTNSDIREFCGGRCGLMGNPDAGGVAFAQLAGGAGAQAMAGPMAKKVETYEADVVDYMIPEVEDLEATPNTASWGLERVGVPTRAFTGRGQTIYVQDTGVRFSHNDFGGRAFPGIDLTTGQGVEVCDEASRTCSGDRQGHGTHCAGSAAGTTFGVASDATVRSLKTLSDQGSGSRSWQFAAIDWVTANGVKPSIISMSLGGRGADSNYNRVIGAATEAGITIVVASGNSNSDACNFSPAFAEKAITVGSTTSANARSSFSNYGRCQNIYAPGSAIMSADARSDTGSRSLSGTSMACPHVSGAAALLLEEDNSLKRDQILSKLHEKAYKNFISGTRANDPIEFLWVGAGDAPTPPPTPAPPPSVCGDKATGPDLINGDCTCNSGLVCFEGSERGCTYSYTARFGWTSTRYFLPSCEACDCKEQRAAGLSEVESAGSISLSLSDCGGSRHVAKLTGYSPKSVQTGQTSAIRATGQISEDVSGGRMNMVIKMTSFPWTTLASVSNHNICQSKSLDLRAAGVNAGRLVWEGLPCNMRAGGLTVPLSLSLSSSLPANLANVAVDINGTSSNGKPLFCASVTTSR